MCVKLPQHHYYLVFFNLNEVGWCPLLICIYEMYLPTQEQTVIFEEKHIGKYFMRKKYPFILGHNKKKRKATLGETAGICEVFGPQGRHQVYGQDNW